MMLNREGWSLLLILAGLLALLGAGFAWMGRERSMEERLRTAGREMDTAAGLAVRAGGVLLLAVLPGIVYLYGLSRVGMAVSLCVGVTLLLCVLLPRLRAQSPEAMTVSELFCARGIPRAVYAAVAVASLLALAAGAVSLLARIFAGVFSLHYTIALAAAAALVIVFAVLCGSQARRRMDRLQVVILLFSMVAVPVTAILLNQKEEHNLLAILSSAFSRLNTGRPLFVDIASDLLFGVGVMGATTLAQRWTATREDSSALHGGRIGAALICLMALLSVASGLLGRMVDSELGTQEAAETVFLQMASNALLPAPLAGLLVAALVTALTMTAQDLLRTAGVLIAWDGVQNLTGQKQEKPLRVTADLCAVGGGVLCFVLALDATLPLLIFAQIGFLLSSVLAVSLWARAQGWISTPRGAWIGLAAGALVAAVWMCIPVTRGLGMIGVLPCAAATLAPQILLREAQEQAEEQPEGEKE